MKKTVAFVLALLLLCGSAICEGLAETNRGGVRLPPLCCWKMMEYMLARMVI